MGPLIGTNEDQQEKDVGGVEFYVRRPQEAAGVRSISKIGGLLNPGAQQEVLEYRFNLH